MKSTEEDAGMLISISSVSKESMFYGSGAF